MDLRQAYEIVLEDLQEYLEYTDADRKRIWELGDKNPYPKSDADKVKIRKIRDLKDQIVGIGKYDDNRVINDTIIRPVDQHMKRRQRELAGQKVTINPVKEKRRKYAATKLSMQDGGYD